MLNPKTNLQSIIKYLDTLRHLYGKNLEKVPQEDKTFFHKVLLSIKYEIEKDDEEDDKNIDMYNLLKINNLLD